MHEGVLPIDFTSLTLRILDADRSVTLLSPDAVVLETARGMATDVTPFFSVDNKGEIIAAKPDAVRDAINGYFGPLTLRVMAWDADNFFYDSRVEFFVGRYGLKGKIFPPAENPATSTANIAVGLTGPDGEKFWARTDANGNYAFSSLPTGSYLVRADKLTSSATYAVRAPLFLNADTVQDFTLKSLNELFPASSAAPPAARSARARVESADDGTYTIDLTTAGTSATTQPNGSNILLEIPQGTQSVTLTYNVETQETVARLTASPPAGDYFGIGLQYGDPFYGNFIANPMDQVNLMYAHGAFPNGVPGKSRDFVVPVDVSKLTASGPLKVKFGASIVNCCKAGDSLNDTTLHVTLTIPQSCPVPPSSSRVTTEATCPPTIQLLGITPDGTPPNGSDANNDDNYYSIPRPGQSNYWARNFYIGLRTTPADASLTADIDVVNQETNAAMQRIHSDLHLDAYAPLQYILPMSFDRGLASTINGTPPPAYQIRYHFHVTAEKDGVTTAADYYSDTTGNAPEYSLWRMTPMFTTRRFGGGHFTAPFEGICLGLPCYGGDNWSSRGAYAWMETNTLLLTRVNHISGENGRYTGHSGHARGSDIDIYHFWPTVNGADADPIGGDVYNTLRQDAMTAHDINDPNKRAAAQAAINEITTWLNASRTGIDALLNKADVAQVGYLLDGGEFAGRHRAAGKGGTPGKAPLNIVPEWGKLLLQTGIIHYNDGTSVDTNAGLWSNRTNAKMFYWPGHHTHVHITLDRCAIDHLGCASGHALFCDRPFVQATSGNATINPGESATIGVSVSGSGPYFVQWTATGLDESETLLPATGTSVTVTPSATTIYTAKVANYCGDDASPPIVVTVRPPCVAPVDHDAALLAIGHAGSPGCALRRRIG